MAATMVTTSAMAANIDKKCANDLYRKNHPERCVSSNKSFWSKNTAGWLGGAAALGAGLAVVAMAAGGGSGVTNHSSGTVGTAGNDNLILSPTHQPTLPIYDTVGYTDPALLSAAMSGKKYVDNAVQYNEIRAAYSLARGYTGRDSTIAILDSGNYGWHGNAVKNIAGGAIAPGVDIKNYQIVDTQGDFIPYAKIGDIIASANDANIFNASWGVESQYRLNAATIRNRADIVKLTDEHFVNEMVNAAERDAIFVWAAGNEGRNESTALAALPRVVPELNGHFINVVAWDNATGTLADYSNACGATKMYCITAPGTDMNVGFGTASGTSFAAPVVSAAVAVIREAWPHMTATEITQLLFATARDLGDAGVDEVYGWGMLDLERATRPVGAALVPVADTMQPLRTARAGGVIGRRIRAANLGFAFFDAFGRPFAANLNDNISFREPSRAAMRLSQDEPTSLGQIGGLEFGLMRDNLLTADGFLQTDRPGMMTWMGTRGEMNVGNIRLYQRSRLGVSRPHAADDSMISDISPIYTASVSVGAAWGDWTFAVSADDVVLGGNMKMHLPTGRATNGTILYTDHTIDLASRPSVEYSVTYKFITGAWVDNPDARDEFYLMARGRFQF